MYKRETDVCSTFKQHKNTTYTHVPDSIHQKPYETT